MASYKLAKTLACGEHFFPLQFVFTERDFFLKSKTIVQLQHAFQFLMNKKNGVVHYGGSVKQRLA